MKLQDLPNPLVCHGHTRPVVEFQYSRITPDGYFLSSASKDGQPMIRNGETGDWIGTFQGHKGAVWSCVLNAPAFLAATASADYTMRVWDALTGDQQYQFEHPSVVRTCNWAENGNLLVSGGMDKKLRVYDLQRPETAPEVSQELQDKLRLAMWCSNDKIILSTYSDKPNIDFWDTRSWQKVRTIETGGHVTSVELSSEGRYMTVADGKDITVFDTDRFAAVKSLSVDYGVESATFCAAKNRVAAGGEDMWVHLYDATTWEEVDTNKGHHGPVHCVRFAPTADSYASGSEDGTIRIWHPAALDGKVEHNGQGDAEH